MEVVDDFGDTFGLPLLGQRIVIGNSRVHAPGELPLRELHAWSDGQFVLHLMRTISQALGLMP